MSTRATRRAYRWWTASATVITTPLWLGCGTADDAGDYPDAEQERPAVVETRWSDRTELFVEYPVLVEGETSRFAIHFTELGGFEPVTVGRAAVRLTGPAGEEEFTADEPGRPGIFGIDVTPSHSGRQRLVLSLATPTLTDRHDLGEVVVIPSAEAEAATLTGTPDAEGISFLKEQQWTLDFGTAPAERRELAESLVIAAEIEPRTGGQVDVAAPVPGRLAGDVPALPVGAEVSRGQILAEVIPHSAHGEDRPALQLDVAEARDVLELARSERARVERLVAAGALPSRRLLEVEVAERTAEARLTAAEAHLAQLETTRTGEGEAGRDIRFVLRAPIRGVVAESTVTPGASVEAGMRLFRLVALDRVHIVGSLPEAALPRIDELVGAELSAPGLPPTPLDRLVARGRVLDPRTRTVPIIYELRDPDRRLAIGQAVSLRVFVTAATDAVTVPGTAIVDDAGQPVIFVQTGGETFERRAVQLGNREGGSVQVVGDIAQGERVVVRGAPFIRLAALSPQVPAHGHTH